MDIIQLIEACGGPKAVRFQPIDVCATSMKWSEKIGAQITFGSDVRLTPEGTEKFGIVIWLDRDAVKAALATAISNEGGAA